MTRRAVPTRSKLSDSSFARDSGVFDGPRARRRERIVGAGGGEEVCLLGALAARHQRRDRTREGKETEVGTTLRSRADKETNTPR